MTDKDKYKQLLRLCSAVVKAYYKRHPWEALKYKERLGKILREHRAADRKAKKCR